MVSRRTDATFDLNETWSFQITCHDDNDATIVSDLTGATVSLSIAALSGGGTILTTYGVVQNPSTAGMAVIFVTPSQQSTYGIVATRYTYTIRVQFSNGQVSDQAFGMITVRGTEFG